MRHALFIVLALVPVSLISWIVWSGQKAPPVVLAAASSSTGHAVKTPPKDPLDEGLLAFFEGEPGGAKVKDKVALYDEKGLFDYIDGAAPLYLERHFRKLGAAEMTVGDGADLTCDIYDMTEPENAASIFLSEKSAASQPVDGWPQAVSGSKSFMFRAGRFYVKLTAFADKSEAALPELARALRERMR